jgi:membrane protease YdiL (CAAX protease family)
MTDLLHHLAVLFLVVFFPLWDRVETRRLKRSSDPRDRIRSYRLTMAWQLALSVLLLATIPLAELFGAPAHDRVFGMAWRPGFVLAVAGGLFAGLMVPVALARFRPEVRAKQVAAFEAIAFVLPRTREERAWFAALCVVVGVCEEIIFRGFLIRYMLDLPWGLGTDGAVVAAALVFGLAHGYQGWTGLVGTTILALVFSVLFLATGSLWVPIVLHVLIDLRVLLLLEVEEVEAHPG